MRRITAPRLFTSALAVLLALTLVTSASAGRAWCRADPVLVVNGNVVDIQVASNLAMYNAATGPIEMVVTVKKGTQANVLLQDFGFGRGYDIKINKVDSLNPKVRAVVAVRAPASDSSLPVSIYGTRISTNLSWLLKSLDILWLGQAHGNANEWVVLEVR